MLIINNLKHHNQEEKESTIFSCYFMIIKMKKI